MSFHLLALGCFSFEMGKHGRTVFLWKQHLYVNVVFKQTWINSFIAKSLLLLQPTPFGRQNAITRKCEEEMKQLIVENWGGSLSFYLLGILTSTLTHNLTFKNLPYVIAENEYKWNNTIKAGGSTVRAQSKMSEWVSGVEWMDTP